MAKPPPAQKQWENELIAAYYDYRYKQLFSSLYGEFERWKTGDLTHEALNSAIHETHKESASLYSFFGNSRKWLITLVELDIEWFNPYLGDHPAPPGVEIAKPLPES